MTTRTHTLDTATRCQTTVLERSLRIEYEPDDDAIPYPGSQGADARV